MSISTQAAVTVATSLGLPCAAPEVLHDGSNVVVHLRPTPVVARVATLTALVRPGVEAWFARDAAVAAHLAARGVPATRPYAPPVRVGDAVVGLWHHEPHDPSYPPTPVEVASSLAALHEGLRDLAVDLPRGGPCDDIARALDVVDLPGPARATLLAENERLRRVLAEFPARPLHGDAHPGNLLATSSGLVWNDFEDAWSGPLGWDLACLVTTGRVDGRAAVAAYPDPPPDEELAACVRLRVLFGVVWPFVVATRFPARRAGAEAGLTAWLAAHGDGEHGHDQRRGAPQRQGGQ